MERSTRWLRISYWTGAIADGLVCLVMLSQAVLGCKSPLTHHMPEIPYRYAMGLAGSLMLGWTILLLWANRKPIERRGILIITNIVILGLMASGIYALYTGFVPLAAMVPVIAIQFLLIVLFTYSYLAAGLRK